MHLLYSLFSHQQYEIMKGFFYEAIFYSLLKQTYCRILNLYMNFLCFSYLIRYANTHTLISPSKRAKKDNAIASTSGVSILHFYVYNNFI